MSVMVRAESFDEKVRSGKVGVIELSWSVGEGMPVYPGDAPVKLRPLATLEKDGYYQNELTLSEHAGTHVDAPSHFAPKMPGIDGLPVQRFFSPAVVVDLRAKCRKNRDYELSVKDLEKWEAEHGPIPEGALVMMLTGWGDRWRFPKKYLNLDEEGRPRHPGFGAAAAEFILKNRKVHGIGIDTLSTDPGRSRDLPVHKIILGAGLYQVENLRNLEKLPPSGAWVLVAPIKIAGGSGAPARVLAFVEK